MCFWACMRMSGLLPVVQAQRWKGEDGVTGAGGEEGPGGELIKCNDAMWENLAV